MLVILRNLTSNHTPYTPAALLFLLYAPLFVLFVKAGVYLHVLHPYSFIFLNRVFATCFLGAKSSRCLRIFHEVVEALTKLVELRVWIVLEFGWILDGFNFLIEAVFETDRELEELARAILHFRVKTVA